MIAGLAGPRLASERGWADLAAPDRLWFSREWLSGNGFVAYAEPAGLLMIEDVVRLSRLFRRHGVAHVAGIVNDEVVDNGWALVSDTTVEDLQILIRELSVYDFLLHPLYGEAPAILVSRFDYRVVAGSRRMTCEWFGRSGGELREEFSRLRDPYPPVDEVYQQVLKRMDW